MDRSKILKYGALGTVAAVTGKAVRPAMGEAERERPNARPALAREDRKAAIKRIEAITSFIPGVDPEKGGSPPLHHQV